MVMGNWLLELALHKFPMYCRLGYWVVPEHLNQYSLIQGHKMWFRGLKIGRNLVQLENDPKHTSELVFKWTNWASARLCQNTELNLSEVCG